MLPLRNLADATLAPLSILRKSRWRQKWQQILGLSRNIVTECIRFVFYMQISTEIALLINMRHTGMDKKYKDIKNASKMAAKSIM